MSPRGPRRPRRPGGGREADPGGPLDPGGPFEPQPTPTGPAGLFADLDGELPLALFPVRLEARFLPDADPDEIVVRVFPDEIHADAHDPAFTDAELALAQGYWDWLWRVGSEPAGVAEARDWLAGQLGPHRAVYVAWASRPATEPPTRPQPGTRAKLRPVAHRDSATPGTARLMPARWGAFVEGELETAGPFWATHAVASPLPVTPALVDLPPGADGAKGFLDAQGLSWTYDLAAAESAGMVIRIPIAGLPPRPRTGYPRLVVVGVAEGDGHGETVRALLDAHRYTHGLELLPPGTPTNVTDDVRDGAGGPDLGALFDAEFARPEPAAGGREAPVDDLPFPRVPGDPADLLAAAPGDAVAQVFGLAGETAAGRAAAALDPAPELARAAAAALWPATWGTWLTDPMSRVADGSPLLEPGDIETVREWFADFVRAEGPLPTLRVGRHPYGLLPAAARERRDGGSLFERLENLLLDLLEAWTNLDAVPVLDPDAADVPPSDAVAEQASDVGAVYGATPHIRELRLRPVSDDHRELTELFSLRLGFAGLLCALVPKDDDSYATPDEVDDHLWYKLFREHEAAARGSAGVQAQIDAIDAIVDGLENLHWTPLQEEATVAIRSYLKAISEEDTPYGSGDVHGMASRHRARVADGQPYLTGLGIRDELGTGEAPRLYTGGYGDPGTETEVGALVAPAGEDPATTLSQWLETLRRSVTAWQGGGDAPVHDPAEPASLLQQLLGIGATSVARGPAAVGFQQALGRLRELVDTDGAAAIPALERLLRATLGLATYRVDAWLTALASERLGAERVKRPAGLQVGGYGWLVDVGPREGRASQGFIHAPSLDHATTAAVLRSGWSAFGTEDAGSPLAVDLSSNRIRAARWLIEGVRSGLELGRLLGGRLERRLHDRHLDAEIDELRAAVLSGSGLAGRPATRIVDGLLVARAYTEGIETTTTEQAVRGKLEPIVSASPDLLRAVQETVADLDAVSDLLVGQAVHSLLRGDAGVAAPTLAATGSGDSGLPALDFPATQRGGRLVTVRVTGTLAHDAVAPVWPGAGASVPAAAEPRLERWVGQLLGDPADVVIVVQAPGGPVQADLAQLGRGALDAVLGIDALGDELLAALALGPDAAIVPGRPEGLADDRIAWDEFVSLARSVRALLGRIRPLGGDDLAVDESPPDSRDLTDLQSRLAAATARVPAGDPRVDALAAHREEHPEDTADVVLERLAIVCGGALPILPLLADGVPASLAASFGTRQPRGETAAWLAQAAKVRPDVDAFTGAARLAELLAGRPLTSLALAQLPDGGGPWAGSGAPSAPGPHTAWCNVTGLPGPGSVAGFVVDAWTETIPATRTTSGIAVHFDRPSAAAPNAILLAVTRPGQAFDLDLVHRCVGDALANAQYRALGADSERRTLGQFLPAVFLPEDAAILATGGAAT